MFDRLSADFLVKLAKVNDVRVNTGQSGPVHAIIVTHAHSRDLECLVVKWFALIINTSVPTIRLISSAN